MPKIYKLPWTKEDNPNGWLEITTNCQLKCPGCYRGLDKSGCYRFNEDLNELKSQVDWFVKNRNVQTISISGGEPLLYPHLEELVKHISSRKLYIKIYTNGLLLKESLLRRLGDLGVTEFIIHIDSMQGRKEGKKEKELNVLRREYCELFRKVGKINLGFIMPLSEINFGELDDLMDFYIENADVINLVVFTTYNPEITLNGNKKVKLNDIAKKIKEKYSISPCACLGKTLSNKLSWLFFSPIIKKGKVIGEINPRIYKKLQQRYYAKRGKYFITARRKDLDFGCLMGIIGLRALKHRYAHSQTVLIIDSPSKNTKGWDLCDGCPDPIIRKGQLVPSCLLERIKKGESIKL
jgi:hypothetical protein